MSDGFRLVESRYSYRPPLKAAPAARPIPPVSAPAIIELRKRWPSLLVTIKHCWCDAWAVCAVGVAFVAWGAGDCCAAGCPAGATAVCCAHRAVLKHNNRSECLILKILRSAYFLKLTRSSVT